MDAMLIVKWLVNSYIVSSAASHLGKYFMIFYCHSISTDPPSKQTTTKPQSSPSPRLMKCKKRSTAQEHSEISSADFPVVHSKSQILDKFASPVTRTNFYPY